MLNSEKLKSEIDKIPKEYYSDILTILKSFKTKKSYSFKETVPLKKSGKKKENWSRFISQTYGSLSEYPIERGEQGNYESREEIA